MSAIGAIEAIGARPAAAMRPAGEASALSFERAMSRAQDTSDEELRGAAQDLVAQTLVLPILAQLRSTNNAAAPFAPGPHEKYFAPLFDAEIAQRIVRSTRFPLVDTIVARLDRGGAGRVP